MHPEPPRTSWSRLWPFALLCMVSASRWIAADPWPQTGSTLRSEAAACAIAAAGLYVLFRLRARGSESGHTATKPLLYAALAGAALLAMPALGAASSGAAGEPYNRTAAMCLVPLVAAVCVGIRSGAGARGLGAPLAGVAGALLLFPLALPVHAGGWAGLLLPPIIVGIACGLLFERSASDSFRVLSVAFLAGGALGLLAIEAVRALTSHEPGTPLSVSAICLDLLIVSCVVLSLRGLGAERYATRYLLAPVLTILEGMVLLRPGYSLRVCTGLVLLAGAAMAICRKPTLEAGTSIFSTR